MLALGVVAALLAGIVDAPSSQAEPPRPPSFTPEPTAGIPSAAEALATAEQVLSGETSRISPTLALRDLSARLSEYSHADLARAQALLARPNGGDQAVEDDIGATWGRPEAAESPLCDDPTEPRLCVHWTDKGVHAPPLADGPDPGSIPDQVDTTLAVMLDVWGKEVDNFGYRPPLTDERASVDVEPGFDVYLSEIGDNGYYGYCAVDDSHTFANYSFYDRAAYCVLDNDYSSTEFPANTALQNLKVTAAHEFFHAIQFAYDAYDDDWFMEGTAAWIEDEVYDRIDDNRQFLADSSFTRPGRPLDTGSGGPAYGAWGFFRFLSERHDRTVVRDAWSRADGSPGGPDDYSLQAIQNALAIRDETLQDDFSAFAAALLDPGEFFSEGSYYPSPDVRSQRLGVRRPSTGWKRTRIDHLAASYRAVSPRASANKGTKVRVQVDAPQRVTQPRALVLTEFLDGTYRTRLISLARDGDGATDVPFAHGRVLDVTVVLVNGSDRFTCFAGLTPFSCGGGQPRDDDGRFRVRVSIL